MMCPAILLCSLLLGSQGPGQAQSPDEPPSAAAADLAPKGDETRRAEALVKYEAMRSRTAQTAAAQWKLASWCEDNGLEDEAMVHLANVVRLDPKRDAAWRRLGFKKYEGRWMTEEQIVELIAFRKAEKAWGERLKAAHKHIHGGPKKDEAEATLDGINEVAAVPAIYREFCGGGERDQRIAVKALGQVQGPLASKVLAGLAIFGKTPEVQRLAIETLFDRPADDYLDYFVGLLRDPFRYEVRPVGGPGSPGVLFVEGERFNVQRFYAVAMPTLNPRIGDAFDYDANGDPYIQRTTSQGIGQRVGVPGSKTLATEKSTLLTTRYTMTDVMAQVRAAAQVAQRQLADDIAMVRETNEGRRRFNDLVMRTARITTGEDPGDTPQDWRDRVANKYDKDAKQPDRPNAKPTVSQMVPINYMYSLQPSVSVSLMTRTVVDT
jgi:hypothetical protein